MPQTMNPRAGALVDGVAACLQAQLAPGCSGWSSAAHLRADLRARGVEASAVDILRAARALGETRPVRLLVDDAGVLWYRLR